MCNRYHDPFGDDRWKENLMLIVAGGHAGIFEAMLLYPFDIWRTRMKWIPTCSTNCLIRIYREEGFLAYWKGFSAYLGINVSKKTIRFFTFEKYRKFFACSGILRDKSVQVYMFSGFLSGSTESVVMCPLEVVKITQQLNFERFGKSPSMYDISRKIILVDGFRGFYKGLDALLLHHSTFSMMYFTFYHSVLRFLPTPNRWIEFVQQAGIAFMASIIPGVILLPLELARVRIQGPQPVDKNGIRIVKYQNLYQTLGLLFKERGLGIFYKGLAGRIIRSGSSGTILLIVFEYTYLNIKKMVMNK